MAKGYEITKAVDIIGKLSDYRKNYHNKGMYLGWEKLHEHYSMQLGNCTDWTGYPMSGKTQVLMELLLNTSIWYGWRHLVYFPDVGSNVEIIADLIHKKTGKSFDPLKDNSISDDEIRREVDWITHHFLVLTKKEIKAKMTPIDFWDMAVQLKKDEDIQTASIDSWKDLSHNYAEYGGYAQYLEFVLPYRNQIAEDNDLHLHTIIHPKLTDKENGKRKPPVPYDLKGGSEWFNSGKCMITVHREDLESGIAEIYFNKIKPRAIGKIGKIDLRFDLKKFRFFDVEIEESMFIQKENKIYATPKNAKKKIEKAVYFNEPKQTSLNYIKPDDVPF